MIEINKALTYHFQGVGHYFCSNQCLNRFIKHPHLFVGDPLRGLSEKQKGRRVLKTHALPLVIEVDEQTRLRIEVSVNNMMGVDDIKCTEKTILVTYDLIQISLNDIENNIIELLGKALDESFVENIKRGFFHYIEECELENLASLSKGGKCH